MSENTVKSGISKKQTALISTGIALLTYVFCESGILHLFSGA